MRSLSHTGATAATRGLEKSIHALPIPRDRHATDVDDPKSDSAKKKADIHCESNLDIPI